MGASEVSTDGDPYAEALLDFSVARTSKSAEVPTDDPAADEGNSTRDDITARF
jgi:hypothetical protein